MVLISDGYLEHVAHEWRKTGLLWMTEDDRDHSALAHPCLSYHLIKYYVIKTEMRAIFTLLKYFMINREVGEDNVLQKKGQFIIHLVSKSRT